MNRALVTITSEAKQRTVPTKNGDMTIHFQYASLETEKMRIEIEQEIEANKPHAIGAVLEWDVVSDLDKGKYGPELKRKRTLKPYGADAKPAARVA